jgi:hypothetical protein
MNSFARPNLFEVSITPKEKVKINGHFKSRLVFNCFQADIPGLSIATVDRDKSYRGIAYQKLYEDVTLGFYVNVDMKEIKFFQNWMEIIVRPEDNHVGFYNDYVGTVEIKNLDRQQETVLTTKLHDAYPKSLSAVNLDYGTTDTVMTISITMTYRHYTQEFVHWKDNDNDKEVMVDPNEFLKKQVAHLKTWQDK